MLKTLILRAAIILSTVALLQSAASAQTKSPGFDKKVYTISKWTKGSELVTVSGPSKMIFLSGVGAEDENSVGPTILHLGDPLGQCRYAEDKIKRLLERQGATMGDIVKVVAYTTDIRYRGDIGKCEAEAFGDGPRPDVHTAITVNQLAHPGMLVEIDVTAMEPASPAETAVFEKKNYNYSKWTPGRLSEVVTVSGPSKMIFLSGVGAENENSTGPTILHLGDPLGQCRYAVDKIKRLLAHEGANMGDIVKMVVYVTDIRSEGDLGKCETEAFGSAPRPAHTFLNIGQLAHPGMLLELDATAMVPAAK